MKQPFGRLSGKRILVTAAGRGIGRAAALACAREGASVHATDIDPDVLIDLASDMISVTTLDNTDPAAVAAYARTCPTFDAVVHCVGIVQHGSVLECSSEDWRRAFRINVDSFYFLLQAVLPPMLEAGGGSITCISSVASSIMGIPHRASYGATKAAMIGLVKSVAADYVGKQIRCNAICPGTILSPSLEQRIEALGREVGGVDKAKEMFVARQPMGRLGTPEEVAELCVYLASDESRFVTSQLISIDGGMSM
ncbi:MAG: SDR family oxidoreductase [Steroidobacter sp.]